LKRSIALGSRETDPDYDEPCFKAPKWNLSVFRYAGKWDEKEKQWQQGAWAFVDDIEVGFREDFHVLAKGEDYYFLTESGKLFLSPPAPALDKPRKMVAVWEDEKRPVVAYVTDADADRTFLFCRPEKKDGKGVYFELSDKPDPVEYDPAAIPAAKPDDPLPAVLAYAKVLLADKKIKDAKPKD
jgi:hypothetical protein